MLPSRQQREFGEAIATELRLDDLLRTAIEWIKNNLEPDDVFGERELESWAIASGFIREE